MGYHIRLYDQRMGYLSDWSGCKFYFFTQDVYKRQVKQNQEAIKRETELNRRIKELETNAPAMVSTSEKYASIQYLSLIHIWSIMTLNPLKPLSLNWCLTSKKSNTP